MEGRNIFPPVDTPSVMWKEFVFDKTILIVLIQGRLADAQYLPGLLRRVSSVRVDFFKRFYHIRVLV